MIIYISVNQFYSIISFHHYTYSRQHLKRESLTTKLDLKHWLNNHCLFEIFFINFCSRLFPVFCITRKSCSTRDIFRSVRIMLWEFRDEPNHGTLVGSIFWEGQIFWRSKIELQDFECMTSPHPYLYPKCFQSDPLSLPGSGVCGFCIQPLARCIHFSDVTSEELLEYCVGTIIFLSVTTRVSRYPLFRSATYWFLFLNGSASWIESIFCLPLAVLCTVMCRTDT